MDLCSSAADWTSCCTVCGNCDESVRDCIADRFEYSPESVVEKFKRWERHGGSAGLFPDIHLAHGVINAEATLPLCFSCQILLSRIDRLEGDLKEKFALLAQSLRSKKTVVPLPDCPEPAPVVPKEEHVDDDDFVVESKPLVEENAVPTESVASNEDPTPPADSGAATDQTNEPSEPLNDHFGNDSDSHSDAHVFDGGDEGSVHSPAAEIESAEMPRKKRGRPRKSVAPGVDSSLAKKNNSEASKDVVGNDGDRHADVNTSDGGNENNVHCPAPETEAAEMPRKKRGRPRKKDDPVPSSSSAKQKNSSEGLNNGYHNDRDRRSHADIADGGNEDSVDGGNSPAPETEAAELSRKKRGRPRKTDVPGPSSSSAKKNSSSEALNDGHPNDRDCHSDAAISTGCDGDGVNSPAPETEVAEMPRKKRGRPRKSDDPQINSLPSKKKRKTSPKRQTKKDPVEFACAHCEVKCSSLNELRAHGMDVHGAAKPFSCPDCRKNFSHQSALSRHKKEMHLKQARTRVKCPHCPKTFTRWNGVRKHANRVHGEQPTIPCGKCKAMFVTTADRRIHAAHCDGTGNVNPVPAGGTTGEEHAVCPICGDVKKGANAQHRMTLHIDGVHKKIKKYKCGLCPAAFEHCRTLIRHESMVHGVRPERFQFPCDKCGKVLQTKHDLELHKFSKHQILERDVQVFTCAHCSKKFLKKLAYELHVRVHEGVKPHACTDCEYRASSFGALKSHMKSTHQRNICRVFAEGCKDETIYTIVNVGWEDGGVETDGSETDHARASVMDASLLASDAGSANGPPCCICHRSENVVDDCNVCLLGASGRRVADKMREWEARRFAFSVPDLVFGVDFAAAVLPLCSPCLVLMASVDRLEAELQTSFTDLAKAVCNRNTLEPLDCVESTIKQEPDEEDCGTVSTKNRLRSRRDGFANLLSSSDELDNDDDPDFKVTSRITRSSRKSARRTVDKRDKSPPQGEKVVKRRRGRPKKARDSSSYVKNSVSCDSGGEIRNQSEADTSPPSKCLEWGETCPSPSDQMQDCEATSHDVKGCPDSDNDKNPVDDALLGPEQEVSCKQCGAKCSSLRTLKFHEKSAHGEASPFHCPHCSRTFLRESVLKRHTREVHLNVTRHRGRLKCPECPKSCANHDLLRLHLHKTHNAPPSLACKKCDRKFVTSKDVRKHTSRCDGSGNETIPVDEPLKRSVKPKNKSSSGENGFAVCQICGVTARGPAARGKINYHVTAVHEKVKKFKCHLCPEAFEHHGSRRRHLARAHKVGVESFQFTCDVCGQFFEAKRDLERHKFSKHQILMRDVQVYTCQHCNKQFIKKQAFEGHVRLHAGVKPHTCPQCEYSSTLFGALKRHMRVAHGRNVKRLFAEGCKEETVYTLVDVDGEEEGKKKKSGACAEGDSSGSLVGPGNDDIPAVQQETVYDIAASAI